MLLFPLTAIVAFVVSAQKYGVSYRQRSVAAGMESAVMERGEVRNLKLRRCHSYYVITFDAEANIVNSQIDA
jgi:hypothetical protein